jgi:hypothetical protein
MKKIKANKVKITFYKALNYINIPANKMVDILAKKSY